MTNNIGRPPFVGGLAVKILLKHWVTWNDFVMNFIVSIAVLANFYHYGLIHK